MALKPGKPLCVAVTAGCPVVVLPGFPTSAIVTFHTFVAPRSGPWPACLRMIGRPCLRPWWSALASSAAGPSFSWSAGRDRSGPCRLPDFQGLRQRHRVQPGRRVRRRAKPDGARAPRHPGRGPAHRSARPSGGPRADRQPLPRVGPDRWPAGARGARGQGAQRRQLGRGRRRPAGRVRPGRGSSARPRHADLQPVSAGAGWPGAHRRLPTAAGRRVPPRRPTLRPGHGGRSPSRGVAGPRLPDDQSRTPAAERAS